MNLRISAPVWASVWNIVQRSFTLPGAPEWGLIGLVGVNAHPARPSLLVADLLLPGPDDFGRQSRYALTFHRSYLRRAMLQARTANVQGLVTFHSHPDSLDQTDFSPFDESEDPLLMANLHELMPNSLHASVVVGRQSLKGRAWLPDGTRVPLEELVIVGDHLVSKPLSGEAAPPPPRSSAVFDRALVVTGTGALAQLARMRIAVVGASGTGSLMAELLVRAGAGHITLIDPDTVRLENLNRILHATAEDARQGRLKVAVLKRALDALGLPTDVVAWPKDIVKTSIARELAGFDLLVGCVDRHWPRLVLNQVAYHYLLPLIDVGTEIGVGPGGVEACTARTSYVSSHRPCLVCGGVVDLNALGVESLGEAEQARIAALGYGAGLSQPAVMELNTRAASYGAIVLRHLLQPMLREPLPIHILESLLTFGINPDRGRKRDPHCLVCGTGTLSGLGDAGLLSTRTPI